MGSLLNDLVTAAHEFGLAIEQQQIEGDPALFFTLPTSYESAGKRLSLESLELHRGELYVAGSSVRDGDKLPPLARKSVPDRPGAPEAQLDHARVQR